MPFAHDRYAKEYDDQVKTYHCHIADVVFGLSYEFVKRGDAILDVGIGTGLSSTLFHKAGLQVTGIDASGEMLKICKKKKFTDQLIEHDLLDFPWPFHDKMFDHVVCCGVFHFMGELDNAFAEIARIQKTGGIFAFTVKECKEDPMGFENFDLNIENELKVFSHKVSNIDRLMKTHNFIKQKEMICLVGQTPFRVIVGTREKKI